MSVKRFLLGCLVAGIVCNASGITAAHFFFREAAMRLIERLGGLSAWAPVSHIVMRLAMGSAALWVFVATRSRIKNPFGALLVVTCTCWVIVYPPMLEVWRNLADLSWPGMLTIAVWGFVELGTTNAIGYLVAGKP